MTDQRPLFDGVPALRVRDERVDFDREERLGLVVACSSNSNSRNTGRDDRPSRSA